MEQFGAFLEEKGKDSLGKIRETLRGAMTEKVGVFRKGADIEQAVETIKALKKRAEQTALSQQHLKMNQELVQRWELDNLLAVSMTIARGALYREESRGGHTREDFPARRDEFNHHTLVFMKDFDTLELGKRPVDMSIYEAKGQDYEKFGMIERKY